MDLEKILKSNKSIEVRIDPIGKDEVNLHTLIDRGYNYDTNTFSMLAPRKNNMNYPLHHEDKIDVFFIDKTQNQSEVHSFKAKVIKKEKKDDIFTVVVKKISEVKHIQRRNSFRFPITKEISIIYKDEKYDVLTKDLSSGGARFVITKKLYVNDEIEMILTFDDDLQIKTKAKVLESSLQKDSMRRYNTRVKFIGIEQTEKDKLMNYIFKKQSERLKKTSNSDAADSLYKKIYGDFKEKRTGKDIILKTIDILSYFSLILLFMLIVFFLKAMPDKSYSIGRIVNRSYDLNWKNNFLNITFNLSIIQVILTTIGLSLNSFRLKRKTDKYNKVLIFNLITGIFISIYTFYLQFNL